MPNNDYILRSDVLEHFGNYLPGYSILKDDVIRGVKELPAADVEPKQNWIPVTERLPEVGQEVLVFAVGKSNDFSSTIAITDRMIFRLFPSSEGVETWSSPWQYFMTNYEITHWMPLPSTEGLK